MSVKEDLRVVKTKRALLDAFFSLAAEKKFEDITVNELCDVAEVRRATFYKHFSDKMNFLSYMTKTLRQRFDSQVWSGNFREEPKEYFVEYTRALIKFLVEHEVMMNRMLESEMRGSLLTIIVGQNTIDTQLRLEKTVQHGRKLPAKSTTLAKMLTGGISNIIIDWIENGRTESEEELTSEISLLIDKLLV